MAAPANAAVNRLRKGRDLVRRTARLLSSARPIDELFDELATLLGRFVDTANVVVATAGEGDAASIAFLKNGVTAPVGAVDAVLRAGKQRRYITGDAALGAWDGGGAAVFVPIVFGGNAVGVLGVQSNAAAAYDQEEATLLETCALYLGARLHDARQREQQAELERLALTDGLTGLYNRRAFDRILAREWSRCARAGEPLALALLDIDYFKKFNDTYGHLAGDTCLRQVAQAIAGCVKRPGDSAARYGGEEFVLVLPSTTLEGAVALGEAVCEAIRSLNLPHQESSLGIVSASIGVTSILPSGDDPESIASATAAADAQLYRAKEAGRNRVAAESYDSQAPPAAAKNAIAHNLPAPRTAFVGRDADVTAICGSIDRARLVTIAGMGGVGKTRLALEVARSLVASFADGLWLVDLATVTDPALVASTIAFTLGLDLGTSADAAAKLVEQIGKKRLLLVLDNCERVVEETARIADALLAGAPGLRILVTSREPLRVSGESLHRLAPFDRAAAVELFRARAADANPRVRLDEPEQSEAVRGIVRRLEGIPLAIELAAARARSFDPSEILAAIERHLEPDVRQGRAAVGRHQTLNAAIELSYRLLSESERRTFRGLCIFAGTFTVDAADAVAVGGGDPWLAAAQLDALADKSMLVPLDGERYRLLDSLREFARREAMHEGEYAQLCRAHARYFEASAKTLALQCVGDVEDEWGPQFRQDLENYRSAMDWSLENDPAPGAHIAGNLRNAWEMVGLPLESLQRPEAFVSALGERARSVEFLSLWLAVAWGAFNLFQSQRCIEAAEIALQLARETGNGEAMAVALNQLGFTKQRLDGDPEEALALVRESVALHKVHSTPIVYAAALGNLGAVLLNQGKFEEASSILRETTELGRSYGVASIVHMASINLAEVEFALGNVQEARVLGDRCVDLSRSGGPIRLACALLNAAAYSSVAGDYAGARATALEAIAISRDHAIERYVACCVQTIALCEAATGDAHVAATFLGFVDAAYELEGSPREPTEAVVLARIEQALAQRGEDPAAIERSRAAGRNAPATEIYALLEKRAAPALP